MLKKILILLTIVTSLYSDNYGNRNIYVNNYYHPRSEPKGLYIVDFYYYNRYYQYRVYCPTGDVREITNGYWGKARKAYREDRRNFRSVRVVREAVDTVCKY